MSFFQFTIRLLLALLCGASIGFERQWRQRMAGLRTNALVAAGAALFVSMGAMMTGTDSMQRIAAQIVSGIGFLGAGVIMREGLNVRGLNTAATLWCTAAIGTLAGCGFLLEAVAGAVMVIVANVLLRPLAHKINHIPDVQTETETLYLFRVGCARKSESVVRLLLLHSVNTETMTLRELKSEAKADAPGQTEIKAVISAFGNAAQAFERVITHLSTSGSVNAVSWKMLGENGESLVRPNVLPLSEAITEV